METLCLGDKTILAADSALRRKYHRTKMVGCVKRAATWAMPRSLASGRPFMDRSARSAATARSDSERATGASHPISPPHQEPAPSSAHNICPARAWRASRVAVTALRIEI